MDEFESIVAESVKKILEDENLMDEIRGEIVYMCTKGEDRLKNIVELVVRSALI